MAVAVLLVILFAVLAAGFGILKGAHWHSTPPELRGDWWGRFERQFRAYAETARQPGADWPGYERRHRPR